MNVLNLVRNASLVRFKRFLNRWFSKNAKQERLMRKQMRSLNSRLKANQQECWNNCPHTVGSNLLSSATLPYTSIIWHRFDDGVRRGICTVCQRWFLPTDSDFNYWRSKRSFNKPSSAGIRTKFEDVPVYPVSYLDQTKIATDERKKYICQLDVDCGIIPDPDAPSGEGLDALSDLEIKELYEASIKQRKIERAGL